MMYMYISTHLISLFFFFNDTATTEIYTLSLHDALPISKSSRAAAAPATGLGAALPVWWDSARAAPAASRSEEHTSELQSRSDLVCRLLLEKKKKKNEVLYHKTNNTCIIVCSLNSTVVVA